ncbi:MAG: RidA family protein [Acidobacteria bacterium]|nr:RidA family protein [Acidobacteriota bacterium]
MVREALNPAGAAQAIGPYSPALRVGNLLFLSGSIPIDPATGQLLTGDITEQATRVMENIGALLEAGGGSYRHVVKTTVFLTDMNEFAAMNQVYAKYFAAPYPARATVQVSRLPRDCRIEVEVIAVLD